MGCIGRTDRDSKKKVAKTEREITTPLFLLRCTELGLSMNDLDELDMGTVLDMLTEKANDSVEYAQTATQDDFDNF